MASQVQYHGQFGEDRILAGIFSGQGTRACVEVGANDGITGSSSLHFERKGWRCVLIEPNPVLCARLRAERTAFIFEGAASSTSGTATLMLAGGDDLSHAVSSIEPGSGKSIARQGFTVQPVTVTTARLDDILEQADVKPGDVAFVSIDVEGHEPEVLKGFTLSRWRPEILIIEDNSLLFGNGLRASLAKDGYVPFRRTGVNDWYAPAEAVRALSDHPARSYLVSMVQARALMLRRKVVQQIGALPIVGRGLTQAIKLIRGNGRG